jgi:serine/threonine-protein kinase RsbW
MEKEYYSQIVNSRNEIEKIEKLLFSLKHIINLTEEKFVNLLIVVTEGIINGIVHGNHNDNSKKVYFDMKLSEEKIEITIRDEGTGFNLNYIPDPTLGENIYKESGRGLLIMKSLVDEFRCESNKDGTKIFLVMYKNKKGD